MICSDGVPFGGKTYLQSVPTHRIRVTAATSLPCAPLITTAIVWAEAQRRQQRQREAQQRAWIAAQREQDRAQRAAVRVGASHLDTAHVRVCTRPTGSHTRRTAPAGARHRQRTRTASMTQ
jgi:hypothetical protein